MSPGTHGSLPGRLGQLCLHACHGGRLTTSLPLLAGGLVFIIFS